MKALKTNFYIEKLCFKYTFVKCNYILLFFFHFFAFVIVADNLKREEVNNRNLYCFCF